MADLHVFAYFAHDGLVHVSLVTGGVAMGSCRMWREAWLQWRAHLLERGVAVIDETGEDRRKAG